MKIVWKQSVLADNKPSDDSPIGTMDDQGYLHIVARKMDITICGKYNFYDAEVEAVLAQHADVADSAAFGLPDEKWGGRVAALVLSHAGVSRGVLGLIEHWRAALGLVKVPKAIVWCDELPRNAAGNLLKHLLRSEAAAA